MVGVLIDSPEIDAWSFKMLQEIYNSDYAEIKLFIKNNIKKTKSTYLKKLIEQRRKLFF